MILRAAIYARVSSQTQRDAHTIENQLRVLPAFVKSQGWELVGPYIDDGRSASTGKLAARGGFAELVRDAEAKKFDLLVVIDVDRLTRTDSIEERATILGPFQRLGIDIVTPSSGRLDMRTMFGELWITMKALAAAEERRKIGERSVNAHQTSIARGRKPGGRTPYGLIFDKATGVFSIDPLRAPIVAEIFARCAAGEGCHSIAMDLAARDAPRSADANAEPGLWRRGRVWDLVHARYPMGEWFADRRRRLTVTVPAIVDEALWQRAQDALRKRKVSGLVRTRHIYLLEGLARCGLCGARMGIRHTDSKNFYICQNRKEPRRGAPHCRGPRVPTDLADARVWQRICARVAEPGLAAELAHRRAERVEDAHTWEADAAGYRARLAKFERKVAVIGERFRRDLITEAELDVELEAIRRDRTMVRAQLKAAEDAHRSTMTSEDRLHGAMSVVQRLLAVMPTATPEIRRELVQALVDAGTVTFRDNEIAFDVLMPRTPNRGAISSSPGGGASSESPTRGPAIEPLRLRLVA